MRSASSPVSSSDDATLPPLRGAAGRVCPVCRELYPGPGASGGERCLRDGAALVDARAFAESGEDALLGRTVAGRFTVLAKLGAGSMGTVYRARQEAMGRFVALKILRGEQAYDASAKARFEREARANSALASPHTVTAFDFGVADDGSLFLAMELLEGESLGQRIRRTGKIRAPEAVRIAREALLSLAEAHKKGIIHRDIKPDNLFLARMHGADGIADIEVCKVLDFGIAKVVRGEGGENVDALETQAGTVFGTPRYMSPEQAQGKPLDPRSDLYSLGVILYHMLCGAPPFEDEDAVIVMAHHIRMAPRSLREAAPEAHVPDPLERVVLAALSKDPSDRPASAEHFISALDEAMVSYAAGASGIRAALQTFPSLPSGAVRRKVVGLFAASAIMLLVIVLVVWLIPARVPAAAAPSAIPSASAASAATPAASLPASVADPAPSSTLPLLIDQLPPADDSAGRKRASSKSLPDHPRPAVRPPAASDPPPKGSKYGRFD